MHNCVARRKLTQSREAGCAVVGARESSQALHRHAHAVLAIETPGCKSGLSVGERKELGVRCRDAAGAQALGVDRLDGAHFGVLSVGWEFDQPRFQARGLGRRETAADSISVQQCLRASPLRRSAHLQQRLKEGAPFALQHGLGLCSQFREVDVLGQGRHVRCDGSIGHRAHRTISDEGQALERADAGGLEAPLLEQTVHQEHAPAIGQGVVNRPRQLQLMGWEVLA